MRMFPGLNTKLLGQAGSLYHNLREVLETFCNFRPDVSYVQGMSYLAAVFLVYMQPSQAFICLSNMVERDFFKAYLQMDVEAVRLRFQIYELIFRSNFPHLFLRFQAMNLLPDCYLMEWCMTLYTKHLSLPLASRVWDGYFIHGEEYIFKTAVAIVKLLEPQLNSLPVSAALRLLREPVTGFTVKQLVETIDSITLPAQVDRYYRRQRVHAAE